MAAVTATGRTQASAVSRDTALEIAQLISDAEAWNCYARKMNQRALERGLVTAEQLARDRATSEAALARLRARLAVPTT